MGLCHSNQERGVTCWPCNRRQKEKVVEYQNIFGPAEEFASEGSSSPRSKHSMAWGDGRSHAEVEPKQRRGLDDLYDQLEKMSRKVKRHHRQYSMSSSQASLQCQEAENRDKFVFQTQLMEPRSKQYNGGSMVFHSQNLPMQSSSKPSKPHKESATLINQLNVLQSSCQNRLESHDFKKKSWTVGNGGG